jgi:hypothetical protein
MERRKPKRDLAKELYARRHDPVQWEEVEVKPASARAVVTSFRMPENEFEVLHEAAGARGESLSEFIRKAVALRLHGKPVPLSMNVTSGAPSGTTHFLITQPVQWAGRTEIIPAGVIGGLPPLSQHRVPAPRQNRAH